MTMLIEDDVQEIEHLDFAVPCEAKGCETPATHEWRCRECSAHRLLCGPHAQVTEATFDRMHHVLLRCGGCGSAIFAEVWRRLFEFRPIGGQQ